MAENEIYPLPVPGQRGRTIPAPVQVPSSDTRPLIRTFYAAAVGTAVIPEDIFVDPNAYLTKLYIAAWRDDIDYSGLPFLQIALSRANNVPIFTEPIIASSLVGILGERAFFWIPPLALEGANRLILKVNSTGPDLSNVAIGFEYQIYCD